MSWTNPFEFKLDMDRLEEMSPDEVDIRMDYGRAPIRSLRQFREWISAGMHAGLWTDGKPVTLRLRSDEACDFVNDLGTLACHVLAHEPPGDLDFQGYYLGCMHGVHVIEDYPS